MQKPYFIQPGSEPIKPSEKITRYEVLEPKGEAPEDEYSDNDEDEYGDNELTLQNILDVVEDRDPAKVKIIARSYRDRCDETRVVIDIHHFYESNNPNYEKEMERYLKAKARWDHLVNEEKKYKKLEEMEKLKEAKKLLEASGYKIHKK